MAWQKIPDGVLDLGDPSAVYVYAWCRRRSDWNTGVMQTSIANVAREAGVSTDTASRALRKVAAAGFAVLEGPPGRQRWRVIPSDAEMLDRRRSSPTPRMDAATPPHPCDPPPAPMRPSTPAPMRPSKRKTARPDAVDRQISLSVEEKPPIQIKEQIRTKTPDPEGWREILNAYQDGRKRAGMPETVAVLTAPRRKLVTERVGAYGVAGVVAAVRGMFEDETAERFGGVSIETALRINERTNNVERYIPMGSPKPIRFNLLAFMDAHDREMTASVDLISAAAREPTARIYQLPVRGCARVDGVETPLFVDRGVALTACEYSAAVRAAKIMLTADTPPDARAAVRDRVRYSRSRFEREVARALADAKAKINEEHRDQA